MPKKLSKPLEKPDRSQYPFYRYGEGWWMINATDKSEELGRIVRIHKRWFDTVSQAKAAYDIEYRRIVEEGLRDSTTKWEDLRDAYIEERKNSNIALSSILTKDRAVLKVFFDPFYAGKPVYEIFTKREALAFKKRLFELKNHFGDPYGVKDVNRAVSAYRMILRLAAGMDLIDRESYYYCDVTVLPVKRRNSPSTGRERPTFALTAEEEEKLLDAIPEGTMDGDLFRFLLWTGFRIGEALALTPNEIDFVGEKISKEWNWVKDDKGGMYRSKSTKNGCEGDYVVSSKVIELLSLHIKIFGIKNGEYLFHLKSNAKKPLDQSAFGKRVKRVCEELGVRYCHPHILRHTFCTKLSAMTNGSNLDRKAIEGLTGHTFQVDQSTYNHASEERMRELVNKA